MKEFGREPKYKGWRDAFINEISLRHSILQYVADSSKATDKDLLDALNFLDIYPSPEIASRIARNENASEQTKILAQQKSESLRQQSGDST